jgi:hypothetical protein
MQLQPVTWQSTAENSSRNFMRASQWPRTKVIKHLTYLVRFICPCCALGLAAVCTMRGGFRPSHRADTGRPIARSECCRAFQMGTNPTLSRCWPQQHTLVGAPVRALHARDSCSAASRTRSVGYLRHKEDSVLERRHFTLSLRATGSAECRAAVPAETSRPSPPLAMGPSVRRSIMDAVWSQCSP